MLDRLEVVLEAAEVVTAMPKQLTAQMRLQTVVLEAEVTSAASSHCWVQFWEAAAVVA